MEAPGGEEVGRSCGENRIKCHKASSLASLVEEKREWWRGASTLTEI